MFNPYFLGSMLRSPSIRQDIVLLAQGISRYNISKTKVMDIEVPIPNLQEQAKIGETFRSIDSLITLHQRKYEKLINIKKALLDKMFPKNGELVPQLRFKGFTDAWEQRGLSELAQVTMGQSPNGINYTSNPEDHILVQGNADMENGWVTPRVWTTQITKIAEPNDLVFSVRAPVGAVGKTKFKAVIGRGVASIRGNEFVFQELLRLNMNNYWKTISTGSTFDSISSTELKTTIVRAPQIDEQNKIGGFLNSIDSLITLHQRKYEKLVNIKKALLQKMFV
jgi:type I restriction enzyme S subunit